MSVWFRLPDDSKLCTDDLTIAEACELERSTGKSWLRLNPLVSALDSRAIFVCFLTRTMPENEATDVVNSWTVRDVMKRVVATKGDDRPKEWEDGLPVVDPKAETAGSETTS